MSSPTTSKKIAMRRSVPERPAARNPIPGPAEIAASQVPKGRSAAVPVNPPNPASPLRAPLRHPLLHNPTEEFHGYLDITPEIARELLAKWNPHNRPFSDRRLKAYALDVEEGRFFAKNGETISFDWDGYIVDGQHRLEVIGRTGRTLRLLVVAGLDPAARKTVDIGAERTLAHILALNGAEHAAVLARASRLLIAYANSGLNYDYPDIPPNESPNKTEVEDYYAEHSDELEQAARTVLEKVYHTPFFKAGVICFFYTLFSRQNTEVAKLFLYQLASAKQSPAGIAGLDSTHPVFLLRAKLSEDRGKLKRPAISAMIGMTLKTWIAVRDRKPTARLHVQRNESFPDIEQNWPPAPQQVAASASH